MSTAAPLLQSRWSLLRADLSVDRFGALLGGGKWYWGLAAAQISQGA